MAALFVVTLCHWMREQRSEGEEASNSNGLHFKGGITITKMYSLLGLESELSTSNKLLIYKTILKAIWTYGIQLWGTASTSNIEILERSQSKTLRMIVGAPWYVPNTVIRWDLQTSTVK
jgi:hypothetical protein